MNRILLSLFYIPLTSFDEPHSGGLTSKSKRTDSGSQAGSFFWSAPVLRRFQKGAERQEQTEWSRSALFNSAGGQVHSKRGFQPVSPSLYGNLVFKRWRGCSRKRCRGIR
jgi:hypothetical protein